MGKPAYVTPGCCDECCTFGSVYLRVPRAFFKGDMSATPTWCVDHGDIGEGVGGSVPVSFCPHCGKAVPGVERAETDKKVCTCVDGGYYCNTCGERLPSCSCLPPAFHWRPAAVTV